MKRGRKFYVAGVAATAACAALAAAGTAQAFTSPPLWGCRASALYSSVSGNNRIEPVVANGNANTAGGTSPDRAQCVNSEAGEDNLATPLGVPTDLVTAQTASAKTTITPEIGLAITQKLDVTGRVENLGLLFSGGAPSIGVQAAEAHATANCLNGVPVATGTSQVVGLTLGGAPASLDQVVQALADALAPLGQVISIKPNEQIKDATSLTQRALHIVILQGTTPLVDLVVAEAKVNVAAGEVCNPNGQVPGGGGNTISVKPCPKGAVYVITSNLCVIEATSDHPQITVGRPFQGPSGGRVVALSEALKKYKSPCLTGSGPKFAIIGTNKRDRITGTNKRDRILGLGGNDALDGGRGNDCLDGGTGGDNLSGAIGNDRVYGTSGNDHLNGGPGADYLNAGTGNDTVNAAFGRDRVFGGSGRDFINIATAGPAASANCGAGPDKVRINKNERNKVKGCEVQYIFNDR
jgi:Ca2+-binding RTX toxin-like protein